jgi:hypothetical protein
MERGKRMNEPRQIDNQGTDPVVLEATIPDPLYANDCHTMVSLTDAVLNFSAVRFGAGDQTIVQPVVVMHIPLPLVVKMRDSLTRIVEKFEATYGKIQVIEPPDVDQAEEFPSVIN